MAVADCLEMMSSDADEAIQDRLDAEYEAELERIFGFNDKEEDSWYDL